MLRAGKLLYPEDVHCREEEAVFGAPELVVAGERTTGGGTIALLLPREHIEEDEEAVAIADLLDVLTARQEDDEQVEGAREARRG